VAPVRIGVEDSFRFGVRIISWKKGLAKRRRIAIIALVMNSKLESLLVSEKDVAAGVVADALVEFVQIGNETGTIMPTVDFEKLDRNTKILVYLLALRAAVMLGKAKVAGASAEAIASATGMGVKLAREYASKLKSRYLIKTGEGYELPLAKVKMACAEIQTRREKS
jgi:hypothetical protein